METLVTETNGRLMFTNAARVVRSGVEVSADLAASSNFAVEKANPFLKWIVGDFVEADNPNSNTQFWTKDDLAMGEYSIKFSPLNMLHKQETPIGFFASTQTINLGDSAAVDEALRKPEKGKHRYINPKHVADIVTVYHYGTAGPGGAPCVACGQPADSDSHDGSGTSEPSGGSTGGGAAAGGGTATAELAAAQGSAKIQALAGMWSHVFPFEAALVDQADDAGQLFYSMECRGTHLHCAGPNGCDKSFEYMATETHCEHLMERSSIRHIVNPTFRGGALIIPPTRPGWQGASATVFEDAVKQEAARYAEQSERAYRSVEGALSPSQWEHLMASIITLSQG